MVYKEVWPKTPYLYRSTLLDKTSPLIDIASTFREKTDRWTTGTQFPEWVRVSRAFLSEAMEQYFRNVEWAARIPGSRFTTRVYLSSSEITWDSNFYIGNEINDIRMEQKLLIWVPDSGYSKTVLELYKASPMHMPILKKLEQRLRSLDSRKSLHIKFGISFHRTPTGVVTAVDLSAVDNISFHVERVVLDGTCTTRKGQKGLGGLSRLIRREFERLGRVLVGRPVT
jgi:hypothetical protein